MPPLMLTDDEALAVLLGLLTGRRGGAAVAASAVATESAAAKVRRVLPRKLGRRLDALLETVEFTEGPRTAAAAPETEVLLSLAEAARQRSPVALGYTSRDGRRSERTVHPYGIVAHSGRWYVLGADSTSGEERTFRLDRIVSTVVLPGAFDVPEGFDPADRLLTGLAGTPYLHSVSVLVEGAAEQVRARLPAGLATVREVLPERDGGSGGAVRPRVRVRLRAERLDWVPSVLAGLDLPFVIEEPEELRGHVRALAERLAEAADAVADPDLDADAAADLDVDVDAAADGNSGDQATGG
jgi:predicted DNA-binding transcriptional regulator YafY